eukprot:TRINITY_DN16026_c1_g1_i1.p1 TRINITY_DN16026_c1_g1~~TRINITY_DN16026_c1_g1_i1.p1  ORF type:complete len:118 (+),score=12.87 TRINITY_DN16026_c1_g1_i1:152-505(+)
MAGSSLLASGILLLGLVCNTEGGPPGVIAYDDRNLRERIYFKYVNVRKRNDMDDGNQTEKWILIIMGFITCVCFLLTLCYSVATRGRGKFTKPDIPYLPEQFIEMERNHAKIASGGA